MQTEVTIKHNGVEVSVKLEEDADLRDVFNALHGMTSICGWLEPQWEKCIIIHHGRIKFSEE